MGFKETLEGVLTTAKRCPALTEAESTAIADVQNWLTSSYTKRWRTIQAEANPFALVAAVIKRQVERHPENKPVVFIVRDIADGLSIEDATLFIEQCGASDRFEESH